MFCTQGLSDRVTRRKSSVLMLSVVVSLLLSVQPYYSHNEQISRIPALDDAQLSQVRVAIKLLSNETYFLSLDIKFLR